MREGRSKIQLLELKELQADCRITLTFIGFVMFMDEKVKGFSNTFTPVRNVEISTTCTILSTFDHLKLKLNNILNLTVEA